MKTEIVIGANYGDEGKGHITNFLSSPKTLNVRFNGGAQAAHAVNTNGKSHIFRHFGSGSLKGARTLLGRNMIINPIIFIEELNDLLSKTKMCEIFIDPRCWVTTPFDMLINEFEAKSKRRTGTCGIGINETVTRSKFTELRINMRDILEFNRDYLLQKLGRIKREYVPFRLSELKLSFEDYERYRRDRVNTSNIEDKFIDIIESMKQFIYIYPDYSLIEKFLAKDPKRNLVFEGAQGMLLDQKRKEFMPHLTRSNTGVKNAARILREVKLDIPTDVFLVSRTYFTRHGDGPIWNMIDKPYAQARDETNLTNNFQGKLRYGYLASDWLRKAKHETLEVAARYNLDCEVRLALTCVDQLDKPGVIKHSMAPDGKLIESRIESFSPVILSSGPNEENIKRSKTGA